MILVVVIILGNGNQLHLLLLFLIILLMVSNFTTSSHSSQRYKYKKASGQTLGFSFRLQALDFRLMACGFLRLMAYAGNVSWLLALGFGLWASGFRQEEVMERLRLKVIDYIEPPVQA